MKGGEGRKGNTNCKNKQTKNPKKPKPKTKKQVTVCLADFSAVLQSCLFILLVTLWSVRVVALFLLYCSLLPLKTRCMFDNGVLPVFGGFFTDKDNTYPSWSRRSGKVNCRFTVPCLAVQHPTEMSTC